MFSIFGCPMHHGVCAEGLKDSLDYLRTHYDNLKMVKIPEIIMEEDPCVKLKNLNTVTATCRNIAEYMYSIFETGNTPLFVGGDHSIVMATASAASAYTKATHQEDIGMIYIDAHADINTDETTVSQNIHGIPVSSLLGLGEPKLTHFLTDEPKLKPENIVYLGLRDIDPPELEILKKLNIRFYTYEDICQKGLRQCLDETVSYLSHLNHIHLSFDIDAVDPSILPGVSVPVPGGFTPDGIYQTFGTLMKALPIISYDIVEFNHKFDKDNKTADFVSEFVDFLTHAERK